MARKHVEDYYNQITADYKEMVDALKELEQDATKGLVSPEKLADMRSMVEAEKANWTRINYIIFLLNQPQQEKKKKRYEQINAKQLQMLKDNKATLKDIREENRQTSAQLRNTFK